MSAERIRIGARSSGGGSVVGGSADGAGSRVAELRAALNSAFADRPYPGDEHLALRQPGCTGHDGEGVARFFRGKAWQEITAESIVADDELDPNAFLFFFAPRGFAYFLPGLLSLSLDLDAPYEPSEAVAFALTPPGAEASAELHSLFEARVGELGPEQRRVVRRVLEYLAEEFDRRNYVTNPARTALDAHWAAEPAESAGPRSS